MNKNLKIYLFERNSNFRQTLTNKKITWEEKRIDGPVNCGDIIIVYIPTTAILTSITCLISIWLKNKKHRKVFIKTETSGHTVITEGMNCKAVENLLKTATEITLADTKD